MYKMAYLRSQEGRELEEESEERVVNDYFVRNKEKYLERRDGKQYQIIPREKHEVKSPVLDCFLTRYIYVQTRKFLKKFIKIEEIKET